MAFSVTQRVISSEDMIYSYCDDFCRKAKLLYNAALFRIRNIFTGYEKEHRTDNEEDIFCEVHALQDVHPQIHVRKVISYNHLEKLMHGKSGFLYRTADADSTGDGKASCHRFQKLAGFFKRIYKTSGKIFRQTKDAPL